MGAEFGFQRSIDQRQAQTEGPDVAASRALLASSQETRDTVSIGKRQHQPVSAAERLNEAFQKTIVDAPPKPLPLPGLELVDSQVKPGETNLVRIRVDGDDRDVYLHLPKNYDPSKPMPLMIVYNGLNTTGGPQGMDRITELGKQADEKGFAVAFLAGGGAKGAYNNGEPIGDFQDDVKYTRNVIDTLQNDLNIDKDRTYLVGISWGASMMHRAASQLSDKLAGVVDIAGFMTGKEEARNPNGHLSEMNIHSLDDETIRYGGRTGALESGFGLFRQEPAPYTFNYYAHWNGIEGQPNMAVSQAPNGSNVYTEDIVNPKNGVEVKQITLEGVKHGWPGSFEVPNSISATNETVDFLLRHTRGH